MTVSLIQRLNMPCRAAKSGRALNHAWCLPLLIISVGYHGPAETSLKRAFLYEALAIVLVSIIRQPNPPVS